MIVSVYAGVTVLSGKACEWGMTHTVWAREQNRFLIGISNSKLCIAKFAILFSSSFRITWKKTLFYPDFNCLEITFYPIFPCKNNFWKIVLKFLSLNCEIYMTSSTTPEKNNNFPRYYRPGIRCKKRLLIPGPRFEKPMAEIHKL